MPLYDASGMLEDIPVGCWRTLWTQAAIVLNSHPILYVAEWSRSVATDKIAAVGNDERVLAWRELLN
jgi:hypothetical protein